MFCRDQSCRTGSLSLLAMLLGCCCWRVMALWQYRAYRANSQFGIFCGLVYDPNVCGKLTPMFHVEMDVAVLTWDCTFNHWFPCFNFGFFLLVVVKLPNVADRSRSYFPSCKRLSKNKVKFCFGAVGCVRSSAWGSDFGCWEFRSFSSLVPWTDRFRVILFSF